MECWRHEYLKNTSRKASAVQIIIAKSLFRHALVIFISYPSELTGERFRRLERHPED
jgi:hypothetical protein